MSNLIDLNSRRLRGETELDALAKPHWGYHPPEGRVWGRRNTHLPLNRVYSNNRFSQNTNQESFASSSGSNYRYNNPFAVTNSQTYQNPNYQARYQNGNYGFPDSAPSSSPGDGFSMREAVYGKPYGGFNPPGAGINRIANRAIADDHDIEYFTPLSTATREYNPFGFPQPGRKRRESYQSPYSLPVNASGLPMSIHGNEGFSKMKQTANAFGQPVAGATQSKASRQWDAKYNMPENFKTSEKDGMALINLLILTFVLLILTMLKK
jgi:hypothetical protein